MQRGKSQEYLYISYHGKITQRGMLHKADMEYKKYYEEWNDMKTEEEKGILFQI